MWTHIREVIQNLTVGASSLYTPLIIFVVVDYITGVLLAIKKHKLSSKIGFSGIIRKVLIFAVAILGRVVDAFILHTGSSVENMILLFYLSNEGISILESLAKLGVPFPQKFKDIFKDLYKEDSENT